MMPTIVLVASFVAGYAACWLRYNAWIWPRRRRKGAWRANAPVVDLTAARLVRGPKERS